MTMVPRGRSFRAYRAASSFAVARVRARPSRGLVTGLGIALALGSTFVTVASPTIAGDATLRRTLEEVPAADRNVTVAVSVNSLTTQQIAAIDRSVHSNLHAPGLGPVRTEVEYRTLASPDGTNFRLAGLDRLAESVTLLDGRLPASCTPTRCEVVIAAPTAILNLADSLGLVIVGRVSLRDTSLLAGSLEPETNEVPIIGDGVAAVGAIGALELIGRSIAWVSAIDPAVLRIADIDGLLVTGASTSNALAQSGVSINLPTAALKSARARSNAASNRVALAAAQGAVLLIAFVFIAAAGARREHLAARRLLRQRGAERSAVAVFTALEASWPALIGLTLGIAAGSATTILLSRNWNLPPTDILFHVAHVGASRVLVTALALLLATALVMSYTPRDAPSSGRLLRWWEPTAIDGVGIAALSAGLLALHRGTATASTLVSSGDPLIAMLPLLTALVIAWICVRFVPLFVSVAAHLLAHRAPLTRTALGEVGRRPALPLATAGFLAAATMFAVFSFGYRTTLNAGAHDQAAYAVPFDVMLREGPKLVRPSALRPASGWQHLAPSARSTDVLRRGVSVRSKSLSNDTVILIGLDPNTLQELRGWRSDYGPSRESLRGLVEAKEVPAPFGSQIPVGSTSLGIKIGGDARLTEITAIVERTDGIWHEVGLSATTDAPEGRRFELGPGDDGGRLIGFRLGQPGAASDRIQHHVGEGSTGAAEFTAEITLGFLSAINASHPNTGGTSLAFDWNMLQSDGAVITPRDEGIAIALRLQGTSALVTPAPTAEMMAIPAIVDSQTASTAHDGLVTVDFATGARGHLRVVGIATHFPGAPARFAVVDRSLAQPALDLLNVGLGSANETWIAVAPTDEAQLAQALSQGPFTDLVSQRRSDLEHRLRSDPLSVFTLGLFAVSAFIAGLLAAAALYLSTLADASNQTPLHRALAADGVAGKSLSRMVFGGAFASAAFAIALGTGAALALLALVTRIIAVTATATVAVPPLLTNFRSADVVVSLAIVTVPCVLATALASRSAQHVAASDLLREFS